VIATHHIKVKSVSQLQFKMIFQKLKNESYTLRKDKTKQLKRTQKTK
jgi:hypothetical protein